MKQSSVELTIGLTNFYLKLHESIVFRYLITRILLQLIKTTKIL